MITLQYIALSISFIWLTLSIIGLLKGKAFNPIGRFTRILHGMEMKSFNRSYNPKRLEDYFWFIPKANSAFSFWYATFFNFIIITIALLIGLNIIVFK